MSLDGLREVHWCEGLLLRPHHLQHMQRVLHGSIGRVRSRVRPNGHGVIESTLVPGCLAAFEVSFESLSVIMPSGLEVTIPGNSALQAVSIREALDRDPGGFKIRLGVPRWSDQRPNVESSTTGRARGIYRTVSKPILDENTGLNEQDVEVRLLNASLLLPYDDSSGMETLDVMRVVWSGGVEQPIPREDTDFIPPSFCIGDSGNLHRLLADLSKQFRGQREAQASELSRNGWAPSKLTGPSVEAMLRLQSLSGAGAELEGLLSARETPPFEAYLVLARLVGELESLAPDKHQGDLPRYQHSDLQGTFQALRRRITACWNTSPLVPPDKSDFEQAGTDLVGRLFAGCDGTSAIYLGIDCNDPLDTVRSKVEDHDRFKLVPGAWLENPRLLFNRGFELRYEMNPPLPFPKNPSIRFFRIDAGSRPQLWEQAIASGSLAITRLPEVRFEMKATLYREAATAGAPA